MSIQRPPRVRLVVARYTEDLRWLVDLAARYPQVQVRVYCKGPQGADATLREFFGSPPPANVVATDLPNAGREGHTYLAHILEHYGDGSLADATFFLQGDPTDHVTLRDLDACVRHVLNAVLAPEFSFRPLATVGCAIVKVQNVRCPYMTDDDNALMRRMLEELFRCPAPTSWSFGAGAQFVVTRGAVLSRPAGFWHRCIAYVEGSVAPREGYCLERMWPLLFDSFMPAKP